jgi:uncharacterized protein YecE (DUF72 family)
VKRIYVGTSSWSDHEEFYPPDLPSNQQITFYAQHFAIVEINSTFYRLMPERNFLLWAQRTPPAFLFDVKPYRQLTWHDRKNPPDQHAFEAFGSSLQPLRDAGKLGAVHFQFPPWFKFEADNVAYLKHCRESLPQDRVSVEFRHRSWLEGDHVGHLVDTLSGYEVGLTVVDEPQIGSGTVPTVVAVTTPELSIVRLHGRNAKMWYKRVKRTADRFDYLYTDEELQAWVPNVAQLAEKAREIHIFFNNNQQDYAVRNALQMRDLIQQTLSGAQVVIPAADAEGRRQSIGDPGSAKL